MGDSSRYTPDLFLESGLIADDLTGADPADGDLALARTQIDHREAGDVACEFDEVPEPELTI